MSALEALAIALAGVAAGTINTIVGSGTLVTFPVLLAFGYSPIVANVSNNIGLVPGSLSGAWGYRRELVGQGRRLARLAVASVLGGVTGAVLLLVLPSTAFKAVVPVFIAAAVVLVLLQPRITRWLGAAHGRLRWLGPGLFLCGVYGGYFGAAQGILLVSLLGLALREGLQRINAMKNVLAMLVNLVAGVVFVVDGRVAWTVALLIAVGSTIGGQIGAHVGQRLPTTVLRGVIVVVGFVAIAKLLVG